MAIKGKKKKRSKPASRRPASAPRPVMGAGRKPPWYRTTVGRAVAGVALGVVIILALVWFKGFRDDRRTLERQQNAIEDFTGEAEVLLQDLSPPATEMAGATTDMKKLAGKAKQWAKAFGEAQAELAAKNASAPRELDITSRLIFQSVLQYVAAAETFKLIPAAPKKLQEDLLARATAQVTAADGTWAAGVETLNEVRDRVDLDPISLRAPSAASTQPGGTTIPSGG